MSIKLIGAVSAVEAETTTSGELFVSSPADRLSTPAGLYWASSGGLTLATTASGAVVFAFENPNGSGKTIYLTRMVACCGFSGTAAATRTNLALSRTSFSGTAGNVKIA